MKNILILLLLSLFIFSCEEEFVPDASAAIDEIVVEGYIEAGENARPPYVILTKALSFFAEISQDAINDLYVHDAVVTVTNGTNETILTEICLDNLTDEQKQLIIPFLGLDPDSLEVNICIYLDMTFQLQGQEGESYDLDIVVGDKHLTATARIPKRVGLDSLWFIEVPGQPVDTLRNMRVIVSDPADEVNYYRYFGGIDDSPFQPGINSIYNDKIIDGTSFAFDLPNTIPVDTSRGGFRTFGTYKVGTTAKIKWCEIDEQMFNFWSSLELNKNNQGPFSNYTLVSTNISGGLGIWGGYMVSQYEIDVK